MNPFTSPSLRWFTIAAHRPFVDDLAWGLHQALSPDGPEALADAVVLVPSRRSARALADAFLRTGAGRAVLLPQIRVLGDLDEGEPPFEPGDLAVQLDPAISPLRRRFELARLVAEHEADQGETLDAAAALALADALGALLDSLHIEEAFHPERIEGLVEGDLAQHWRRSAAFLSVATERWPARLKELGLVDPAERRVRLLNLLSAQWEDHPPATPLIVAGATGSAPASARVLAAVASAPKGCVVLPGVDLELAGEAWDLIDDQHPQGAIKALLDRQSLTRDAVQPWPSPEDRADERRGRARRRVINEALRPAEATADWLAQIADLRAEARDGDLDPIEAGLQGLQLIETRQEEEAATVAALLLREALETPGLTCALVTPDQALARRVSARLSRWGVEADSSAGTPLAALPAGVLIALAARLAADPFDPVLMLSILKHPNVRLAREPEVLDAERAVLERRALRGPRAGDLDALNRRLEKYPEARALAADLIQTIRVLAAPFEDGAASPDVAARALTIAVEALAADADGAPGDLWGGVGGEAAAELLAGLIGEGGSLPPATASGFAELLQTLLEGVAVRAGSAAHPRLRILGVLEARLVRADRIVLAGLEEGVWPRGAPVDPFLSRPMRKALGLPSPERRIGQAAHDFAQGASAPQVTLVTTERRGGQPAVPSRWIWRLQTLARGAGRSRLPGRDDLLAWARALDAPISPQPPALRGATRPAPTPPTDVRPRRMPVTRVELWLRDPYAVYGREILKLRPIDPPDAPLDARGRGTAVHSAFEKLVLDHAELPEDVAGAFEQLLISALTEYGYGEAQMARERPLAANLARWVAEFERGRRDGAVLMVEEEGLLDFDGPAGKFIVTAKADRIELRAGVADVLDFKTGIAPSKKQVESGFSPQLTLTGAILNAGGFAKAGPVEPGDLIYVRVTGRRPPAKAETPALRGDSLILAETALDGLKRRVARFDDPSTPYLSWAAPQFQKGRGGDYDHLARLWEWSVVGGDDADGGEA